MTSRALALLGTFDTEHSVQTLSAMARRAGLPVATAHRLAGDLVAWGGLEKVHGEYRVGQRIWRLGLLAPAQQNIAEVAAPFMQDVLFVTHNVVNLFILDGEEVLLVERMSGTGAGQPFRRVGRACRSTPVQRARSCWPTGQRICSPPPPSAWSRIRPGPSPTPRCWRPKSSGSGPTDTPPPRKRQGQDNYGLAVPVFLPNNQVVARWASSPGAGPAPVGTVVPVLNIAARGIARRLGVEHLPQ